MTGPAEKEQGYGGEGPPHGRYGREEAGVVGLESAREAMDRLLEAHLELEDAKEREKKLEDDAPDPHQVFPGIAQMLEFNRKRATHEENLAGAREERGRAEEEYAEASRACGFVPERSAVHHSFVGSVFLVRRETPPANYDVGRSGGSRGASSAGTDGGGDERVFFVIVYEKQERGEPGSATPTSALESQPRTSVGERMAGERTGRGASSRRGRREGPRR